MSLLGGKFVGKVSGVWNDFYCIKNGVKSKVNAVAFYMQQHFLVPVRQLEPKGSGCLFVLPRNIYSVVNIVVFNNIIVWILKYISNIYVLYYNKSQMSTKCC